MTANIPELPGSYLLDYFKILSKHYHLLPCIRVSQKMKITKENILHQICYTELVYGRINKKLHTQFSKSEIEKLIFNIIQKTEEMEFKEIGKNINVSNIKENIKITINQNTCRIITIGVVMIGRLVKRDFTNLSQN